MLITCRRNRIQYAYIYIYEQSDLNIIIFQIVRFCHPFIRQVGEMAFSFSRFIRYVF